MQVMVPSSPSCRLIVITGPSGVGKGSLVKQFLKLHPETWLSVSATTRAPRQGEVDGKHYFFVKQEKFEELVRNSGFLEWAKFAGNYYGTPRKQVQQKLESGRSVLLEIEVEGARQIRKSFPKALLIFLAPPSFEELERRIRGRGTDSESEIKQRLSRAKEELQSQQEFDAVVINDDLKFALAELQVQISSFN